MASVGAAGIPTLDPAAHAAAHCAAPQAPVPPAPFCAGGVRVLRTNLRESDIDAKTRDRLADRLFELIPVGVGEAGVVK